MRVIKVIETKRVSKDLKKLGLLSLYKKAKENILEGHFSGPQLKHRQPKSEDVLYFRINKQYRAFAYLDKGVLKVFEIYDHS